jgi:benzoyl-CoA-dihydrodiol lyase
VDKRKVRRDLADVFCTTAEGIKGRRAKEWGLVDEVVPRSRFDAAVTQRAQALAAGSPARATRGIALTPLTRRATDRGLEYEHVRLEVDRDSRTARLTVRGPGASEPTEPDAIRARGAAWWPIAAFRELDDALCHLRANEDTVGLVLLATDGDPRHVEAADAVLERHAGDWLVNEARLLIGRVLRRLDLTARSFFALVEPGSCFTGTLYELVLAADRAYMLDDPERPTTVGLTALNAGAYPMSHGLSRLAVRFLGDPERLRELVEAPRTFDATEAHAAGLVTVVADDIDYEDEIRVAVEERVSLSPDALTGMEASLRFPGSETAESKIFGRLSAWQNWIFQRPNAVGERGALTLYGRPERPSFDFRRT